MSRGLGDVYKRQTQSGPKIHIFKLLLKTPSIKSLIHQITCLSQIHLSLQVFKISKSLMYNKQLPLVEEKHPGSKQEPENPI